MSSSESEDFQSSLEPTNKKRKRSANYTTDEKNLLFSLVYNYKHIIECKQTDKLKINEKEKCWKEITDQFNSQCPQKQHRSSESLKKLYNNTKKTIRQQVAKDKWERKLTGGGSAKITVSENPTTDLALAVMNEKTVFGLQNKFDSDNFHENNSLQNEFNCNIPCKNKVVGTDNTSQLRGKLFTVTHPNRIRDVGHNSFCPMGKNDNQQEFHHNIPSRDEDWSSYNISQLKQPLHGKLVAVTHSYQTNHNSSRLLQENNTSSTTNCVNKNLPEQRSLPEESISIEEETINNTETRSCRSKQKSNWHTRRRPQVQALHSSHLSKMYGELAEVKLEHARLQLQAYKKEQILKENREKLEMDLKRRSLELDVAIKEAYLQKLNQGPASNISFPNNLFWK